jgi:NAD-reducing hydrogenase small subunit
VRNKTRILVSFDDCAITGNVTAMRNAFGVDDVLNRAYRELSAVVVGIPSGNFAVPKLLARVRPVHEVVHVDYYLPGCPPPADAIWQVVVDLLEGREPVGDVRRFG